MKSNSDEHFHSRYFFDAGIFFECRRCGACCTGDPGIVRISGPEMHRLAAYLEMPVSGLIRLHLREAASGFSIAEEADGRCRFYEQGCRIYPVRPLQCRLYPFWFSRMRSLQQWKETRRQCPGIGNGPLISRERILDLLARSLEGYEALADPQQVDCNDHTLQLSAQHFPDFAL